MRARRISAAAFLLVTVLGSFGFAQDPFIQLPPDTPAAQPQVAPPPPSESDQPVRSGAAEPYDVPPPPLPIDDVAEKKAPAEVDDSNLPQDQDLQIVVTKRYQLTRPFKLAKTLSRKKVAAVIDEAMDHVEKEFPALMGFERINTRMKIVICIQEIVTSDTTSVPVVGTCATLNNELLLCFNETSIADGETPAHELVHAILRGNGISPKPWLEEGIARYIEDRKGLCPAVRRWLIWNGTRTKSDLDVALSNCHSSACGWIVVKYLKEVEGLDLTTIARMRHADVPEPEKAFEAFVQWGPAPAPPSAAPAPPSAPLEAGLKQSVGQTAVNVMK